MYTMTNDERTRFRRAIQTAIEDGEYTSLVHLGTVSGIGSTTLYPFMKRKSGLSEASVTKLRPLLRKYLYREEQPAKRAQNHHKTNGHQEKNGHTNGASPATAPTTRFGLTEQVLAALFSVRETSQDGRLASEIDALIARWGSEGLELLRRVAKEKAEGNDGRHLLD